MIDFSRLNIDMNGVGGLFDKALIFMQELMFPLVLSIISLVLLFIISGFLFKMTNKRGFIILTICLIIITLVTFGLLFPLYILWFT